MLRKSLVVTLVIGDAMATAAATDAYEVLCKNMPIEQGYAAPDVAS